MSLRLLTVCAALSLAALPDLAAGQGPLVIPPSEPPQTRDRLSPDRQEDLVGVPLSIVQRRGLPAGKADFDRRLAAARARHGARSVEVADLLMSFGVGLYNIGSSTEDRQLRAESIPYLEVAIPAYRAAFGDAHPEVALALNSYADAQIELDRENPPPSAEAALEEAYRIRVHALGPTNFETLTNLRRLAMLRSRPSWTRGEPARIEAAAALLRELIARSPNHAQPQYVSAPAGRIALALLYAQNRMPNEARAQLRLAVEQAASWPSYERCMFTAVETDRIESTLAGAPEGTPDAMLIAASRCFGPDDE